MEVTWLQTALAGQGHDVDVITVRWQKYWPEKFVFRGSHIYRLSKPLSGPFGKYRFNKALSAHLVEKQYDGVIAFGLGDDACTAALGFGGSTSVVLRVTAAAIDELRSFGKREADALMAAVRILVDSESTKTAILNRVPEVEGKVIVASSCIELDPDMAADLAEGRAVEPFRSLARQSGSRSALSDAHPILQIEPHQPLVVTCMSMVKDQGVCDLVKAWKMIQRRHCMARLWIIGEGKGSKKVWDEILEQDLVYTAIMPGFFDRLTEIFQAADLYIHPTRTGLACCLFDAARAHGVCTISTATHDRLSEVTGKSRETIGDSGGDKNGSTTDLPFVHCLENGLLVPRHSPETLSESILYALGDGDFRFRVGNQSRKTFAEKLSTGALVEPYLDAVEPSDFAVVADNSQIEASP
jgi:glycosyltransferase involved in cell wall biosynthesis